MTAERSYIDALKADLRAAIRAGAAKQAKAIKAELDRAVRERQTAVLKPEETA